MGQTIPRQHPAVVLRSHYRHLQALVAVAMLAIAALAVTVVLLATDSDDVAGATSQSVGAARVESTGAQMAARRAAVHGTATPEHLTLGVKTWPSAVQSDSNAAPVQASKAAGTVRIRPWAPRYDGGPDEGTRGAGH
jgi:hypothetical protein